MNFSIKLLGEKSVYIHVLHHLSKFGEHRFTNKKVKKILAAGWIFWKKLKIKISQKLNDTSENMCTKCHKDRTIFE